MLYVTVVDNDELYSKRCDISTLTETISVNVGIGNINNIVNSHTASIGAINSNITTINTNIGTINGRISNNETNITNLQTTTTSLQTTVEGHTTSITVLNKLTEKATDLSLGTIKVGY